MRVFAISDLHLSGAAPKPMDIFGRRWTDHWARIQNNWHALGIGEEDAVLIAGDISWAMTLEQAAVDLKEIAALPGRKILLRGNHDYWWNSLTKVRQALHPTVMAIQNDALRIGDFCFCGSRGWTVPGSANFKADDRKIYERELLRMSLSLEAAQKLGGRIIAMIHYPPFNERQEPSGFVELFEQKGVELVVYGHLHGKSCLSAFEGSIRGVEYRLTSCDHLSLMPVLLRE